MKKLTRFMLLVYIFVVQFLLYGIWTSGYAFVQLAIVNAIVLLIGWLVFFHFSQTSTINDVIKQASGSIHAFFVRSAERYMLVGSLLLLFVLLVVEHIWPFMGCYIWIFVAFALYNLLLAWTWLRHRRITFGHSLYMPKDIIFWLSIVGVFGLSFAFVDYSWSLQYAFATTLWFVFFVAAITISKAIGSISLWKLGYTQLYILALVLLYGTSFVLQSSSLHFSLPSLDIWSKVSSLYNRSVDSLTSFVDSWYPDSSQDVDQDLLTGVLATGSVISWSTNDVPVVVEPVQVSFVEGLRYLFDAYDVPLSTQKTVRFRNISQTNDLYALFQTAYEKKLVGSDINPTKLVRCDVYQVMKWILAWWTVSGRGSILDQYREKAQSLNELNGCVDKDDIVMTNNL